MNPEEEDFAHLWIVAKRGQNDEFWLNVAIRHSQVSLKGANRCAAANLALIPIS
jgi:hypothetical protein